MIVRADATLREAMVVIDRNGLGTCFAIQDGRLVGLLSDGDIRRALVRGMQIETPVAEVMKRDYVWLPVNMPLEKIQARLTETIRIIPIVSAAGGLVDYACPSRYHQVPLTQPMLDGNELEYVTDCIRTGWISSQGKYVHQFEQAFGQYVGCPHALAVSNGTVALHLALVVLGIGPGDEVIVPDFTFAAPVNAVLYVGATPVLVDIDPDTMTMDVDAAKRALTTRTRAIIPVHLYGHPADMKRIMALAQEHGLVVVEDCAEAIGSTYEGAHVGNRGDAAIFSFYGNKTITTGEGGMLLFKNGAMRDRARVLRDHGMSRDRRYWHEQVGYNYRMTNIQAAIGVAQMERVEEFVARKRWIGERYRECLSSVAALRLPREIGNVVNSYWLYTVALRHELASKRDEILALMEMKGVEARPVFCSLHCMPLYAALVGSGQTYPVSSAASDAGLSLPSAVNMSQADIENVCGALIEAMTHCEVDRTTLA